MHISKNSPGSLLASFVTSSEIKPGLVLVTGPSGSGKTRWCMDLVEHARTLDLKLGGLISPAIFEGDQKVGIDLLDLHTGKRRRLAYRRGEPGGDLRTSDWRIVAETLDWGNSILEKLETCDLFILDEVGPLEFEHGIGLIAGLEIIDSRKNFQAVVVVRPSLVFMARKRWPWAQLINVCAQVEA
jgi:nucleoside-triphosphatase THEP1